MANLTDDLKEKLWKAIARAEHSLSLAKYKVKDKLELLDPVMIMPYYCFGNDTCIYLKGRVLEDEKVKHDRHVDGVLGHIKNTFKRYETDEIPGIRLKATFAGQEKEVRTDGEGYFDIEFKNDTPFNYSSTGNTIKVQLLERKTGKDELEAEVSIYLPGKEVEYGVISDMDDTVLITNVSHFLDQLRLMLMKNATERNPYPGIAAFLRALCKGSSGSGKNPLFYVSGSEWNIYDLLLNFLHTHNIPEGPLLLRDKGIQPDREGISRSNLEYKCEKIRHILDTYPQLKFICIGDSGQHDPEVYQQIVKEYPNRILCIYIRDVTSEARDKEVHRIAREVKEQGVEMLLTEETLSAARHAARMGWINEAQLSEIEQECKEDEQARDGQ